MSVSWGKEHSYHRIIKYLIDFLAQIVPALAFGSSFSWFVHSFDILQSMGGFFFLVAGSFFFFLALICFFGCVEFLMGFFKCKEVRLVFNKRALKDKCQVIE